jgi:hypothetical protein
MNETFERTWNADIPVNPEDNPPESLEELEKLIDKLRLKALDIKHQLDVVVTREEQRLPVNYNWVKKAVYAKDRTNYSISILQRIAKQRRDKIKNTEDANFQNVFIKVAKDTLTTLVFDSLVDKTNEKLAAMNK